MKDISTIEDKIKKKEAIVYTASEFKSIIRKGDPISVDDVDVVTCGTFGIMSGTMAVLSVPVVGPGKYGKAESITLNGLHGNVGPCPNESLGVVDCIFNGTSHRDERYGGGHLFKDLVAGKQIDVEIVSNNKTFTNKVTIEDMSHARMILTRGAFKNYTGFVNPSSDNYKTIFSSLKGLKGNLEEASVSGCGEKNPIQNDPELRYLKAGASVLINGSPGMIIGTGTRSSHEKPNLSAFADMNNMDSSMMGGFITSAGPECMTSVVTAIPVTDKNVLDDLKICDSHVKLPLADVSTRIPTHYDNYGSVWKGNNILAKFNKEKCLRCKKCIADHLCPVSASPSSGIEENQKCTSCGLCVSTCTGGAFNNDLGCLNYGGVLVPIGIRQSSRHKAEQLCVRLKSMIEEGKWNLRGV